MITDSEYIQYKEDLRKFIDNNCIIRDRVMPGKHPGHTYTWCFYLRNGLFRPDFMVVLTQLFLYEVKQKIGHFNFQLAGLETGSTPMLSGIPLVAKGMFNIDINSFSVRKKQKEYALLNWIEGVPNELPVMIIDDFCNSSMSLRQCHDIVLNTTNGVNTLKVLDHAFCIVNKATKQMIEEGRQNKDYFLPNNINVMHLYNVDDFDLPNPARVDIDTVEKKIEKWNNKN